MESYYYGTEFIYFPIVVSLVLLLPEYRQEQSCISLLGTSAQVSLKTLPRRKTADWIVV